MGDTIYPVKRGDGQTIFYDEEDYKKSKNSFKRLKKYLQNICQNDCEGCKYCIPYKGCDILLHFDPQLNLKGTIK